MNYVYNTGDGCSCKIAFSVNGDRIGSMSIDKPCSESAIGLTKMIQGQNVNAIADKLASISTSCDSCPYQISQALRFI